MAEPLTSRNDPLGLVQGGEGAITGTVVCAAAIASTAGHLETIGQLTLVILGTVGVYWVAHLHAVTIGSTLTHRHHPFVAVRRALRETLPIAGVSVVPLGVLLLVTLTGTGVRAAAITALLATVALLAVYGYVGAARAGLDMRGRVASATAGAGVGLLVVFLKLGLH